MSAPPRLKRKYDFNSETMAMTITYVSCNVVWDKTAKRFIIAFGEMDGTINTGTMKINES